MKIDMAHGTSDEILWCSERNDLTALAGQWYAVLSVKVVNPFTYSVGPIQTFSSPPEKDSPIYPTPEITV